MVMEKGHVVENATSDIIFRQPAHAYTRKLMRATPRPGVSLRDLLPEPEQPRAEPDRKARRTDSSGQITASSAKTTDSSGGTSALLVVEKLVKEYPRKGAAGLVDQAVQPQAAAGNRNFPRRRRHQFFHRARRKRWPGRRIRLRQIHHLDDGDAADRPDLRPITFDGEDIGDIPARNFATLPARKSIQMVFQDPTDSLNPRFTAARAIADPLLRLGGHRRRRRVRARCEELADTSRPAA